MTNSIDHVASASRFAIAAAIIYFAWQLAQIVDNVSVVTQSVDQVSQHIPSTLEEVREIRLEITEIRKQIPEILAEVEAVRQQIPSVMAEVAATRQQIPAVLERVEALDRQIEPILKQIDQTVAVIDKTQRQIPEIVATTDKAIVALNDTRAEVVPLIPQTLEEIRLTREKIDPTLDRVDELVEDVYQKAQETVSAAGNAGQQASEGAVQGFFTGLIKLPFKLVGTLASPIVKNIDADVAKQITERDIELMVEAGNRAIKSGKPDKKWRWENPDSGNSGSIAIVKFFELKGLECIEGRVRINNRRKQIQDKINEFCKDDEGKWTLASEIKP
ncbi:MAG: hypothetical protein OEU50_21705 [Gammaproteobacteria bacterium]|nr:hypothetical protein [Gammaproteobacteria bacterium]